MSPSTIRTALVIAVIAAIPLFLQWRQNQKLEDRLKDVEAAAITKATAPASATTTKSPGLEQRLKVLEDEVEEETAARKAAEASLAKLRTSTAPLENKVVVNFGKVEDLGAQTGKVLLGISELAGLSAKDPATLTPDEKRRLLELQREKATMMGALPEITSFQDNPDEYGRFFRSVLQKSADLSDGDAGKVEAYMKERATLMGQQGLNAAKEPTDAAQEEAWEEKRDAFNSATAAGLKNILPPDTADKIGFSDQWLEFLEMDFDKVTPPAK